MELAGRLHDELVGKGVLQSPLWRRAFREVYRHWFLPDSIYEYIHGRWEVVDRADPAQHDRWLRLAYRDSVCVTQVDGTVPTSSNSAPSLVAATLEALSAEPGSSVLEVGTGTGWTAGLLCSALGSDQITTVDVQRNLVADAGARLARHSWAPTLAVADGWRGYPPQAPFDRILGTCAVRAIPSPWLVQLNTGGRLVVNVRGDLDGGLVVLTKHPDGSARGRFLPDVVSFMMIQTPDASEPPDPPPGTLIAEFEAAKPPVRPTLVKPDELSGPFGFFAQLHLPGVRQLTYIDLAEESSQPRPERLLLYHPDGSRARVTTSIGTTVVEEYGPGALWVIVEGAYRAWLDLRSPERDQFEVAIDPGGHQRVFLAAQEWPLPL